MKLTVNGKMKFPMMFLAAVLIFGLNMSRAEAADVFVRNTLDNKVNMVFCYKDRSTGLWTTAGWWAVEGNSSRKIVINNVQSGSVFYYAAFNGKTAYVDQSALSKTTTAWVSDESFRFDGEGKPRTKKRNLRTELFYGARKLKDGGGYSIRIDTRPVG